MRPAAAGTSRLTRWVIGITATVAGVATAYNLLLGGGGDDVESDPWQEQRGYYLSDATLTELGVDGKPRVVVQARSIEQQLRDQSVVLQDLELDYSTTQAGTWKVTADRGRMPPERNSIQLFGDVTVTGREARGSAIIRTERLAYDTAANLIQTSDPVRIQVGAHELHGRGLRVDLNKGTLRLESSVNGTFKP
jgi:LPS export ABC transporter protein LptC